jgi:signal transduction histidine kinase
VDLKTLLEECAIVVRGRAEEKKQDVQLELPRGLAAIKGDRDKLKQVILNLLSNAIIPPEGLDHVFEKFYRVPGTERTAQGTGLGLSICKRIVEAHDGKISVRSTLGAGSTFTVCLPVKPGVKTDC